MTEEAITLALEQVALTQNLAGSARVDFARAGLRTGITRAQACSPVRLLTPRGEGPAAWAILSTYGGGLLAGDHTELELNVGAGAMAYVSTQSATKVFQSNGERITRQHLSARVEAAGTLLLLPDPVACFAEACYQQRQTVHLEEGASLVLLDWFTSGRHARGEQWAAREYESANEVFVGGRCVVCDRLRLEGARGRLGMTRFNCLAMVLVLGPLANHPELVALRERMKTAPVNTAAGVQWGYSPLSAGMMFRAAGPDAEAAGQCVFGLLAFLADVMGEAPWKRKW